jgi:hypothetical protein
VSIFSGPGASQTWWPGMPRAGAFVLALGLAACGSGTEAGTTVTVAPGAESPVAAVEELRTRLVAGDFDAAGALAVPDQAILASLAEGASPSLIATALEDGDGEVAANFWSGFAQGVGTAFNGEMSVEEVGSVTERGVEFFLVGVTPEGGEQRLMVTRDVDGQRIDLFASFGAGLAEGMISPVELLLGSSSPDARTILAALQDVVPSLVVAATDPSLSPEAVQRILQLIEVITRVS